MNVFTYGSLMFPEVWERVTGLTSPGHAATLADYTARRIRGQTYPALVAEPGKVTAGVLYLDVPPEAIARLDAFEGSFYDRIPVQVRPEDGTEVSAWVYLAGAGAGPDILPETWDAAWFARDGLKTFLRQDPGFSDSGRG